MDEDKLTFIILALKPASETLRVNAPAPALDELFHTSSGLSPTDKRLADDFQMIGDVNIFLNSAIPPPQPPSPQVHLTTSSGNSTVSSLHQEWQSQSFIKEVKDNEEDIVDGGDFQAEVEIMIAGTSYILALVTWFCFFISVVSEPSFRRKGLALEALQLMLGYATGQPKAFAVDMVTDIVTQATTTISSKSDLTSKSCLATLPSIIYHRQNLEDSPLRIPPSCLVTRISDTNIPSIRLFEKLGFVVTKRVEVFREVEMRYRRCFCQPSP